VTTDRVCNFPVVGGLIDTHTFPAGELFDDLRFVGALLHVNVCWYYAGAFHFRLPDDPGWTVAIRPDSAGRVRVEPCYLSRAVATKWAHVSDRARLASLIRDAETMTTVGIC
jgi:hypothetical protein